MEKTQIVLKPFASTFSALRIFIIMTVQSMVASLT